MTEEQTNKPQDAGAPVKIFISYSHQDQILKNALVAHLTPMVYEELIEIWQDRNIDLAENWSEEIDKHINEADIILLLISSRFVFSKYCYGIEMKRALERDKAKEARVIPIILDFCDFGHLPLAALQAAPTDAIPITDRHWTNTDEAFTNVVTQIRRLVLRMKSAPQ
ncbi:MAG TPA: toll/interleukin-1 receptor domain-containing protein [Pyrinomonadaceae bacterium]|jgi:hypothetical protein